MALSEYLDVIVSLRDMKKKLSIPDSPSSSLTKLSSSSESESEDLVANQPIAKPKNGGQVNRDRWIPIATTSTSKNKKDKKSKKENRGI
ncbi:hypothetical protein H4Q26_018371 [Puccinia striiformis f. sp. tritici PST-130]|nr:hypothetical protein H4Q26_018371 [Puccinia striiformis f. sp. tritici PST-130]